MNPDNGNIISAKPQKPTIHWQLGEEPRQGSNECNPASVVAWVRSQGKQVDYAKFVHECFDPVKTPNGSQLPNVLDRAIKGGYISGYVNDDKPDLGFLKALLHKGPVLVGMDFFPSFYNWQGGMLTISGEEQGGHTWLAHTLNFNRKFVGMSSWWGTVAVYKFPFELLRQMFTRTEKDRSGKEHFTSEIYQPYL